jgi:MFS superfamily sulfate permease-like transporter
MTKYQIIVLCLLVSSILSTVFESLASPKKGAISQLHKLFAAITLLIILLIGYRAFFLIR